LDESIKVCNNSPTLSSKTINFSFGTDKKVKPVTDSTIIPKANYTVTMCFIYNFNRWLPFSKVMSPSVLVKVLNKILARKRYNGIKKEKEKEKK
jgi:hypothetical protein